MSFELARRVESSNMDHSTKSTMRKWLDSMRSGVSITTRAKSHVAAAGQGVRLGGEAMLMGGLLGIAHCEMKNGLDIKGKTPIDLITGLAGLAGGVVFAHEEFGRDLTNAGGVALGVFMFRHAYGITASRAKKAGKRVGGTFAGDLDDASDASSMAGEFDAIAECAKAL